MATIGQFCYKVYWSADVYSALSIAESSEYDKTKLLKAYQCVFEAYRQTFRKCNKFPREKDLSDLIEHSSTYPSKKSLWSLFIKMWENLNLENKNVRTLENAAVISDAYTLS